jgi:hypothetical protein
VRAYLVTAVLLASAILSPTAEAAPSDERAQLLDTRGPSHSRFDTSGLRMRSRTERAPAVRAAAVGDKRTWVALDDTKGDLYRKGYTLRAVGKHIEAWVADDLSFPAGDCRPTGSTDVTDAQLADLVREFDGRIYPKETAAFSTPADRDGTDPLLEGDFTGAGDRTVTLIDNVRDDNYYTFPAAPTYVAGFFSQQINELVDRNVMTIDAYDWKHRTGATPPDEPTADLCTSRPARARMYEGTFAHEWQHLLEYYADPAEVPWVNEGLSDYAQTLVGYVDGTNGVYHHGSDPHLMCFQGFASVKTTYNANPRDCGGAGNSLNLWDEGKPAEVLADYGNTYQFMLYLHDRFGDAALSRLHRDREHHGLDGVREAVGGETELYDVIHDFQTMTLVDKVLGEDGEMAGLPRERVTAASLNSTVNLDNPGSYDRPGAPPNGADFVRLRDADGRGIPGSKLRSVAFDGSATLPSQPLTWTVRDGALFSGGGNNTDAAAVIAVEVPAGKATLSLKARYAMELEYDYGYVTVSVDGGRTYTPVGGDKTVSGPLGPGITGTSDGFEPLAYDLSAYAGKKILLGFRYVTDAAVDKGGWYVDDVTLGGKPISDGSTLTGFRSPTQIVPVPVERWLTRLVGIDAARHRAKQVPWQSWAELKAYPKVVAIVSYDDPTAAVKQYAPYDLTVNGVARPG